MTVLLVVSAKGPKWQTSQMSTTSAFLQQYPVSAFPSPACRCSLPASWWVVRSLELAVQHNLHLLASKTIESHMASKRDEYEGWYFPVRWWIIPPFGSIFCLDTNFIRLSPISFHVNTRKFVLLQIMAFGPEHVLKTELNSFLHLHRRKQGRGRKVYIKADCFFSHLVF